MNLFIRPVLGLFFPFALWAAPMIAQTIAADEADLIKRSREIRFEIYAGSPTAGRELENMFARLDRKRMPRAWIRVLGLLNMEDFPDKQEPGFDDEFEFLKELNDSEGLVRFYILKIKKIKATAPKSEVLPYYESAKGIACQGGENPLLCGQLWSEIARYYYDLGEAPSGLLALEQAMRILHDVKGRDRLDYYGSRELLATYAFLDGKYEKALQLFEENYQWYAQNGFWVLATNSSYNAANTAMSMEQTDVKKAQKLLSTTLAMAIKINYPRSLALAYYGQGKLYLKIKNFSKARDSFEKAHPLYLHLKDPTFAAVSKINAAKAMVALQNYEIAETDLQEAEKVMPVENGYDRKEIADIRHEIALANRDYKKAHDYLQASYDAWKVQKSDEAQKEIARLSTQMGLRVEEDRNKILRLENESQAQKLKQAQMFRTFIILLAMLSLGTIWLLVLSLRQNKRISKSKKKIQAIMDNIDEGLLTIDRHLKIDEDYSRHLAKLLNTDKSMAGQEFLPTIFAGSHLPSEQKSMVQEILGVTLGESRLAWEINSDNLPREVPMGERSEQIFTIRWIPIFDSHEVLQALLVSLVDVTQTRAMEQALGAHEKRLRALPDTMRELIRVKPGLLSDVLSGTENALMKLENGSRQDALRDLHTQKGLSRTLGLQSLSQDLHELESDLNKDGRNSDPALQAIRDRINEYRAFAVVLNQNHAASEIRESSWLISAIDPHLNAWQDQMQKVALPLQELRIIDGILKWPVGMLPVIRELCLHAINNSLDHGFILPKNRGQRVDRPIIEVAAYERSGQVLLEVRDNGVGLDYGKLRAMAIARNFKAENDQDLTEILFEDQVSTAEQVTLTSGRGVGLSAIKSRVKQLGGSVGIGDNNRGHGTLLWAVLPTQEPT